MKRTQRPPFKDILVVDDADTIRAMADHPDLDRRLEKHGPLNRFLLNRAVHSLSWKGHRFPGITPRDDKGRIALHEHAWEKFNANAPAMAAGPAELEEAAAWIRNGTPGRQPGVLAQQIIGRFFNPTFHATPESWKAALTLSEESNANRLKLTWGKLTGKYRRAKETLASTVNGDLLAMHGIGVAVHNLALSIQHLRSFYLDEAIRKSLTPELAVERSLMPPPVLLRQALANGAANGCPFSKYTLILLRLREANEKKANKARDLLFMTDHWSRCPADQWIPAVIAGIWKRVMLPAT